MSLPPEYDLSWCTWKEINRIRSEVGRIKENKRKWVLTKDAECKCGKVQISTRLLECPMLPVRVKKEDFIGQRLKDNAIEIADF